MIMKDEKTKFWFKRKLYGYGWTPSTWQGWIAVLVYIIVVFVLSLRTENFESERDVIFEFVFPVAFLALLLVFISYKKGEKPRWQWGKDLGDK